jgi:hypothetical protein
MCSLSSLSCGSSPFAKARTRSSGGQLLRSTGSDGPLFGFGFILVPKIISQEKQASEEFPTRRGSVYSANLGLLNTKKAKSAGR